MKIIGLCGGSGSGKGAVCTCFSKLGVPSVDTDAVYREITSGEGECMSALISAFGSEIAFADGSLNRKKLASIVFSGDGNQQRRATLNKISHKFILDETRKRFSEYESKGYTMAIIDAPLLFESGFDKECYKIICVVADRNVRIKRIMERDNLTKGEAEMRIRSQKNDEELTALCDFVIENNGDYSSLASEVERVKKLLESN